MSASRTGQSQSGSSSGTSTTTPNVPGFLTNPVNEVAWDIERLAQDNSRFVNGPSTLQNIAYHDAGKLGTSPVVDRVGGGQVNAFDEAGRLITGAIRNGANTAGNAAQAQAQGYKSVGYNSSPAAAAQGYAAQGYNPAAAAQAQGYNAAGQVQVKGYNAAQANATGYTSANPAAAQGYTAQGYNPAAAAQAQSYTAQQAKAAQLGPAATYQAAQINGAPIKVAAGQAQASSLLQGLPQYQSQYTNAVVDTTLAGLDRNTARQQAAMEAQAGRDRAFGGSGYALREGVYNADNNLNRATTEAALRDQAFNTAAGLSNLDAARRTDVSQSNAGLRTDANIAGAGLNLQRDQSNQDATNTARAFGADARNTFGLAQGQFTQQANLDNAQRRDAAAALLADARNRSALDFVGRKDAAGSQLADARNTASQFLAGAKNTSALDAVNRRDSASAFGANAKNAASIFNTGQTNDARSQLMQSQLTAGLDYAGRKDSASAFGANAKNTAALDYAGRKDNASQYSATAKNQAAALLANARNTSALDAAGRRDASLQYGASAQNAANQFGAAAQNANSQFNTAAKNQMAQFNAGQQDNALMRQLQGAGLMSDLGNTILNNDRSNIALQATLGGQQRDISNQQLQEDYIRAGMLSQMLGNLPFGAFSGSTTQTNGTMSGSGSAGGFGFDLAEPVACQQWGNLMSLFGSQQSRRPDFNTVLTFLAMGPQGVRRQQAQQRQFDEEEAKRIVGDRLRAQLSPADTAQGSGTGAMPSIEQQMAALNDARLLNPAVADEQAPTVQARYAQSLQQQRGQQAASLFPNDQRAQALYQMGNQSFLDSLGEQYKPQVIGAGGVQSVIGENRRVAAPSFSTVNDTIFRNDPATGQSTVAATAQPSYGDQTQRMVGMGNLDVAQGRLGLDQSQAGFTLAPGQQRFTPDGQPIAAVAPNAGGSGGMTEAQARDGFNATRLTESGNRIRAFEQGGFDFGRSAITGGQMREGYRQYEAAALEWTDSMLRMTSGAQAPESEVRSQMRTYFPQPGDSEVVRQQKAAMRASAEAAAVQRAGPGYTGGQQQQGPIAVNPQTGQRIQWNGQAWVPIG